MSNVFISQKLILPLTIFILLAGCNVSNNSEAGNPIENLKQDKTNKGKKDILSVMLVKEDRMKATGNEPFWLFELDNDSVHFKMMDGLETREPIPTPEINTKDSFRIFIPIKEAYLTVTILNKECIDGMSGFKSPFSVEVKIRSGNSEQKYSGCGDYLSAFKKPREITEPAIR